LSEVIAGVERGELVLMRGLVESTPDAILLVDDVHRIALANEAAGEIFGFSLDELHGMHVGILVPEPSRARHDQLIAGFRREPRERAMGAGMDLRAVRKDGSGFDADTSLRPLQAGSRPVVAAIVRDVTDLRRVQAASGWLTAVVQSSGDAIVGLGPNGRIASWNPAAEQLYGYAPAEVLGHSEEIFAPPDCRPEQQLLRSRALAGDPTTQFETEHVRNDATRFPVSVTTSPIRNVGGVVIGVVVIARDITDRRTIEHELKFLADHDLLTGVFNRRRLTEELKRLMAHALRYPSDSGALLIGDLGNFKQSTTRSAMVMS
jgi:PAS domain S-box-containing protein